MVVKQFLFPAEKFNSCNYVVSNQLFNANIVCVWRWTIILRDSFSDSFFYPHISGISLNVVMKV